MVFSSSKLYVKVVCLCYLVITSGDLSVLCFKFEARMLHVTWQVRRGKAVG